MSEIVVETQNLNIGYRSKAKEILVGKNISLQFKKGRLYSLIGQNGVGKSTFLKTITGIIVPLKGSVLIQNNDVKKWNTNEFSKNVSVVLTEKIPDSNLSVFELIALGRQPYTNWIGKLSEDDLKKVEEAIELTELGEIKNKKVFEISDGQLQRVLIARSLAQDTSIIILDEPTTHLDLYHKATLIKLLKRLTEIGDKCILFSTHDIDLAIQLSDEMIVMYNSKIEMDLPCNFIEKGVFNQLYPEDSVQFDAVKGKFVIT